MTSNLKVEPSDDNSRIKKMEKELRNRESEIDSLKEKLNNNKKILQDMIQDKKLKEKQIQVFELKEIDAKLDKLQKLQSEYDKIKHRLMVTKKLLDEANEEIVRLKDEIEVREKIMEDLKNRGLMDHILGRFPDSFKEYKEKK